MNTSTEVTITLCTCLDEISRLLSIETLEKKIHENYPWTKIRIVNELCNKKRQDDDSQIILGCQELLYLTTRYSPLPTHTIPLKELALVSTKKSLLNRTLALLEGELEIRKYKPVVSTQNLRTKKHEIKDKLSRREFFLTIPVLRAATAINESREIVPSVIEKNCIHKNGCSICKDVCPVNSFQKEGDVLKIIPNVCTLCGACIDSCPVHTITMPYYNACDFDIRVESYARYASMFSAVYIIPECDRELSLSSMADNKILIPDNILIVPVPCHGFLSSRLLLKFILSGFSRILIPSASNCKNKLSMELLKAHSLFIRELTGSPNVVKIVNVNTKNLERVFSNLQKTSSAFPIPHSAFRTPHSAFCIPRSSYHDYEPLTQLLKQTLNGKHDFKNLKTPYGFLSLDMKKCTFCEACETDCFMRAIKFEKDSESTKFMFSHSQCINCGICVSTCPENALTLRNYITLEKLNGEFVSLGEMKMVKCSRCSKPITTVALLNKLKKHFIEINSSKDYLETLNMCSDCRNKI